MNQNKNKIASQRKTHALPPRCFLYLRETKSWWCGEEEEEGEEGKKVSLKTHATTRGMGKKQPLCIHTQSNRTETYIKIKVWPRQFCRGEKLLNQIGKGFKKSSQNIRLCLNGGGPRITPCLNPIFVYIFI